MMKIFLKGKQIWGFLKLRIKKEDVKNMTRERANAIFIEITINGMVLINCL